MIFYSSTNIFILTIFLKEFMYFTKVACNISLGLWLVLKCIDMFVENIFADTMNVENTNYKIESNRKYFNCGFRIEN